MPKKFSQEFKRDVVTCALRTHRATPSAERLTAGELRCSGHHFVFHDKFGQPLDPDLFSRAFARAVTASGLPRIRLHDLQHSWATNAFTAGTAAKIVSEKLGHSGIAIALDTDTSLPALTARVAVDEVAARILGE